MAMNFDRIESNDKVLIMDVFERNGGRHQSFMVGNTDLVDARTVTELKVR